MNVWTTQPRCSRCGAKMTVNDNAHAHKFSCSRWRGWSELAFLPRRDPGRSIRRPWLAKFPKEWRQVKQITWHVLKPHEITRVTDRIAILNDSEIDAHVEVSLNGEVHVKPLDFGRISIMFMEEE